MVVALIVIGVLLLIGLIYILVRNSIIGSRNRVDEAWSGIDVQLKRRHDLVPNLVETVKGYATHERETFEKVTQARAAAMQAAGSRRGEPGGGHAEPGARRAARRRRAVPAAARDRELPAAVAQPQRARGRDPGLAPDLQLQRPGLQHEDPDLPELGDREHAAASPPREFFEIEDAADREPVSVSFTQHGAAAGGPPPAAPAGSSQEPPPAPAHRSNRAVGRKGRTGAIGAPVQTPARG